MQELLSRRNLETHTQQQNYGLDQRVARRQMSTRGTDARATLEALLERVLRVRSEVIHRKPAGQINQIAFSCE
jgi:hypothetical protein